MTFNSKDGVSQTRRAVRSAVAASLAPAAANVISSPPTGVWDAAWLHFKPIWEEWGRFFEEADQFPTRDPRHKAAYKRATEFASFARGEREKFMTVPAPTVQALLIKMEVADESEHDHYQALLGDLRQIAAGDQS